jgi:hypothetical protein
MFAKGSESWQHFAREWYILGRDDRAAHCQFLADYWRMPLWKQLCLVFEARRVLRNLHE